MSADIKEVKVQLVNGGKMPTRGSDGAAGFDLYANISPNDGDYTSISSGCWKLIPTGVKMIIPDGIYGRIAPRSGLALKYGIFINAGVIDNDYRGELGVIVHNHGKGEFKIVQGDRIAQIIFERYDVPQLVQVDDLSDSTARGAGGYGSTGKN